MEASPWDKVITHIWSTGVTSDPAHPPHPLPPFHIPAPIGTAAAEALLSVTGCHPPPSHTPARSGLPPGHRTNDKSFGGRIQSPLSPDPTFQTPLQGVPLPHLGALGTDCTSALAFYPLWLSSGAASGLAPGSPEHLGSIWCVLSLRC